MCNILDSLFTIAEICRSGLNVDVDNRAYWHQYSNISVEVLYDSDSDYYYCCYYWDIFSPLSYSKSREMKVNEREQHTI